MTLERLADVLSTIEDISDTDENVYVRDGEAISVIRSIQFMSGSKSLLTVEVEENKFETIKAIVDSFNNFIVANRFLKIFPDCPNEPLEIIVKISYSSTKDDILNVSIVREYGSQRMEEFIIINN